MMQEQIRDSGRPPANRQIAVLKAKAWRPRPPRGACVIRAEDGVPAETRGTTSLPYMDGASAFWGACGVRNMGRRALGCCSMFDASRSSTCCARGGVAEGCSSPPLIGSTSAAALDAVTPTAARPFPHGTSGQTVFLPVWNKPGTAKQQRGRRRLKNAVSATICSAAATKLTLFLSQSLSFSPPARTHLQFLFLLRNDPSRLHSLRVRFFTSLFHSQYEVPAHLFQSARSEPPRGLRQRLPTWQRR